MVCAAQSREQARSFIYLHGTCDIFSLDKREQTSEAGAIIRHSFRVTTQSGFHKISSAGTARSSLRSKPKASPARHLGLASKSRAHFRNCPCRGIQLIHIKVGVRSLCLMERRRAEFLKAATSVHDASTTGRTWPAYGGDPTSRANSSAPGM